MRRTFCVGCLVVAILTLPCGAGDEKEKPSPLEHKAVAFGSDENANTKKLAALAADGWEYVGPLTPGMVAFRRASRKPLTELAGDWRADDGTVIRIAVQGDFLVSNYLEVSDQFAEDGFKVGDLCLDVVRPDGAGAYKGRGFYRNGGPKEPVTPGDIAISLKDGVLTMTPSSFKQFVRLPHKDKP